MAGLDKRKFFRKKMYIFKIRNENTTWPSRSWLREIDEGSERKTCINSYVPILEKTKEMFVFRGIYDKTYRNKPKN